MWPTLFLRSSLPFLFVGFIGLVSHAAYAREDLPLLLNPAPGVSARIEKQGDSFVLIAPNGQPVELASQDDGASGTPRFAQEDYDYDGHPDFSVGVPAGMVNVEQEIYFYDAQTRSYTSFEIPQATLKRQNCEGLWDIERIPARKAIRSSCRSGARWHYDILQIEPDRSVWISEQSRTPEDDAGWPYFIKPATAMTYDRQGTVLSETVLSAEDGGPEKATWQVPVKRLALYSAAQKNAVTKGYLIEGDTATMLGFEGDEWMKIAYEGKKGKIARWVSMKEAYGATGH